MDIQSAYLKACLSELEALKPGNVHLFADGHGMQVQDFIDSAEVSAPALCEDLSLGVRPLGQRMVDALQATYAKVACNTNLGIVLLAGPVVQAVLQYPQLSLRQGLVAVLDNTTVADAEAVYQGIRLVKPAGMGQQVDHDVSQQADITLLHAMQIASVYDKVAGQYTSHYAEIFDHALPLYQRCCTRWERPAWALTAVYLYWLAHWPDSHIARKYGMAQAVTIQQQAKNHFQHFTDLQNPKLYMAPLLAWDAELKQAGINPGTSADLTVTTALLANLLV
ncbi:triphosphoribosyl-dephospho-CoA synthase [Methylophilus aquaticus]|uniref:Triphosphoribosyl-dephospho-CoA synthase n=1 Tax=Methylophilus aquaticus TaxID=1971610 RepID=A0ABT9JVR9_9PROT|nr:triphosphoribosyl-dephospho-CoA synthase [Methylophilus aquaticus]MDP8568654.1 triphosphoribosyl-dephospho-CoA synthase [Methylophilus aquaticus]